MQRNQRPTRVRLRTPGFVLAGGIAFDLLSFIAWARPEVAPIAFAVIVVAVGVASVWDLRIGVAAVLLELLWGSHGRLFTVGSLSLRIVIFLAVVAATFWHLRRVEHRRALVAAFRTHPARIPAFAFLASIAVALAIGVLRAPFDRVFSDANAMYEPDALMRLVEPFQDRPLVVAQVGGVGGIDPDRPDPVEA